jgi:hypothetical protein
MYGCSKCTYCTFLKVRVIPAFVWSRGLSNNAGLLNRVGPSLLIVNPGGMNVKVPRAKLKITPYHD